tara:strand:- start:237 stop:860 length:624 start_codon:yes stop_codon:yes gene_type:complete
MRAHVTLKVEIGKFVVLTKLEELTELSIGEDATTVLWVLELMLTDVRVNLTSYLSASHLSALGLSKEGSELNTNASWLDETARGTVSRLALLATSLLCLLNFTVGALTESTDLRSDTGELRTKCRELSEKCGELVSHSRNCLLRGNRSGRGSLNYWSRWGSSLLGGGFLRGLLRYFLWHLMNYYMHSFLSPFAIKYILLFIFASLML